MCHVSCITFGIKSLKREDIKGKKIIEIGSCDVNGSIRSVVESLDPLEYTGVDIKEGPGVDIICNAENLIEKFGENSFDVVISTELLEHVKDWKKVIMNIKKICKPGGIMLITTRSYGFTYHSWPYDFWRYELEDMQNIFSDCEILKLEKDKDFPGVLIKLRKPENFTGNNLSDYKLYNIIVNKRTDKITKKDYRNLYFVHIILRQRIEKILNVFGLKYC